MMDAWERDDQRREAAEARAAHRRARCSCGSDPASPCPVCEARMYPEDAPEEEPTHDD